MSEGNDVRIAVTGGFGFIGSFLVEKLLKRGYDILVVDIRKDKVPRGAEFCHADVTDFDQIAKALSNVNTVYHLAGTVLNVTRKNPHLATRLDILGTANVLEACVKDNVEKLMYASSFYVYDGLSSALNVSEYDHSDSFKAEMFGVVKLIGERLILEYSRSYKLKYVILRYGPVYGPNNRCTSVVHEFIKTCLSDNPIIIWGQGKRKNQYTYVEDIAEGSVAALSFENEVFNLISPEQVTIRQIAELLAKKYGFRVNYDLSKPEGPTMPYISPKKAIEKLNWRPLSLAEGIDRTVKVLKTLYTT